MDITMTIRKAPTGTIIHINITPHKKMGIYPAQLRVYLC